MGFKTLDEAKELCQQFLSLDSNWNSYGSRPTNFIIVSEVLILLEQLDRKKLLPDSIVPLASGGIQLEWFTGLNSQIKVDMINDKFKLEINSEIENLYSADFRSVIIDSAQLFNLYREFK